MEVHSTYKYARISAFKARDVAREIQGLPVSTALDILTFTPRKAAFLIGKTLKSAVANAENNHDLVADQMVVKEASVGEGPTFKRFKPRARGSAGPIRKRTAHIHIILSDEIPLPEPKKKSGGKAKAKGGAKAETKTGAKGEAKPAKASKASKGESAELEVAAPESAVGAEEVAEKKAPVKRAATKKADAPAKEDGEIQDSGAAEADSTDK